MVGDLEVASNRRHSGRDSLRVVLPEALRVNANPFQTDLCRNPDHRDVQNNSANGFMWLKNGR